MGLSYVINWGGIEACVWVQVALLAVIMLVPLLFLERPGERRSPGRRVRAGRQHESVRSP
ncbi:MAG: hypothetical protein Ct9H300mP1_11760 [Planctomycetaceae bacterium]|nr:MAG: hypothetical protein Ct9H300mP1_11760 [Planctomycetaceae bacterium]